MIAKPAMVVVVVVVVVLPGNACPLPNLDNQILIYLSNLSACMLSRSALSLTYIEFQRLINL